MGRKVLYVITKSNWGGAQRYVFDLATRLPRDEFDVAVAYGEPGALATRLREAGITTYELTSMRRDISLFTDWRSFWELVRLFKKEKPDVVHLNSSKAGGVGALAARVAGVKKIIFTAHGWPFRESRNILSRTLIWLASYATAILSHAVICVSDYDLSQARFMPGVKALRIYNGISQMEFGSGEKIRSAFPAGAHITGTIGELNKNKNQQALIEEAQKNPDMYVAIVGEGEGRKTLEDKIRKNSLEGRVKLFGFMPASEVLRGFDTFALPSLKEGLPYVLLEAKQAGLPIVANRTGGVGEILDAKDMGDFSLAKMIKETLELYN
jgi:glycosyltransferase involved in cell wall biosynthesis